MKKALAIRHVHFEDCGTLADVLKARGFEISYAEAGLHDLKGIDHEAPDLLIGLGGPISVYEADIYPYVNDELELFKRRIAAREAGHGDMLRRADARTRPGRKSLSR